MDEDEAKKRSAAAHQAFIKRIKTERPWDLQYYCPHGQYIGYKGVFADKCEDCNDKEK